MMSVPPICRQLNRTLHRLPSHRRTSHATHGSSGFTLLELLVVLAVAGLLLVALSQGLQVGLQAWRIQTRSIVVGTDLHAVDQTLRNLISRADPGGLSGQPAGFVGASNSLSFTTMLPLGINGPATRDAEVMVAVDNLHRLQLRWLPRYRNWIVAPPSPERTNLLDNVDHIELAYWQPDGRWITSWTAHSLPKLVRIRIVFQRGSGLRWPDIVVATIRDRWQL
jgi:prepilin-type N-terminal cleavage/methylation domain-containing protein